MSRTFPRLFPRARPARHAGARRRSVPGPAEAARRVAHAQRLDPAARTLTAAVQRRIGTGTRADALHGVWLGQPVHPALTGLPTGFWTSAAVLDFVPGAPLPGEWASCVEVEPAGGLEAQPLVRSGNKCCRHASRLPPAAAVSQSTRFPGTASTRQPRR